MAGQVVAVARNPRSLPDVPPLGLEKINYFGFVPPERNNYKLLINTTAITH